MSSGQHRRQHAVNERKYWDDIKIDILLLALVLWSIWKTGADTELAESVINEHRERAIMGGRYAVG